MAFVRACALLDVAAESAIPVEVNGTDVAIVHSGGVFYAIAACEHSS